MGNQLVIQDFEDLPGPGTSVDFFRDLKVKWVDRFTSTLKPKFDDFSIDRNTDMLSWRVYFKILSDIKEEISTHNYVLRRASWHSATLGYAMVKKQNKMGATGDDDEGEDDGDEESEESDGHTDDQPSISSDIDDPDAPKVPKPVREKRPQWDSQSINPIFFGYSTVSVQQNEENVAKEKEDTKKREQRAITTAKASRSAILDTYEKSIRNQAAQRQRKIDDLKARYQESAQRRELDLSKNQKTLADLAFKMYKAQWDSEFNAAEAAFTEEMAALDSVNKVKTSKDEEALEKKKEELEAFKDAEAQELPAAERLEDIARIEIARWIDEVDSKSKELDKVRKEYVDIRQELETKQENGITKRNQKQIQELRSIVNMAESRVREQQKFVEDALENLLDAEMLMNRAMRIRNQQDTLLPLFSMLAGVSIPGACRLDLLICAVCILMAATFDQKCTFFLRLYDTVGEGQYNSDFIVKILLLFHNTMFLMKMVPFPLPNNAVEVVTNAVNRGLTNMGLRPKLDSLTEYEVKQLIITFASSSELLVSALGISNADCKSQLIMGTYQRNRMSPIALYTRSMINGSTCKYQLHYQLTKYKAVLDPKHMQRLHEHAMAMGYDDPLRADYSKFMTKPKKANQLLVDPLDHGHLHNLKFVQSREQSLAALKVQSAFRAYRDRKIAELAAKHQAFMEAKELAMKEMKAKVMREFRKREAGSGMGKMKWDAQVRMKQAKLRASGQAVSRSDAVMLMMEEAINKARDEINARFKKIEEKEDFAGIDFEKNIRKEVEKPKSVDIMEMFGLLLKPKVQDESVLATIATPREGSEDEAKAAAEEESKAAELASSLAQERTRQLIEGRHVRSHGSRGESVAEQDLRIAMGLPEPDPQHFLRRMRSLHKNLTEYKVMNLLLEFPSKQLLLRYVEEFGKDNAAITRDLMLQFSYKKHVSAITKIFKHILSSDAERGLMLHALVNKVNTTEAALGFLVTSNMQKVVDDLDSLVCRRLDTDETAREDVVIAGEIERIDGFVSKYQSLSNSLLHEMDRLRDRFKRTLMSCAEVEKKQQCVYHLKQKRLEGKVGHFDVSLNDRQSWMLRLKNAMKINAKTFAAPSKSADSTILQTKVLGQEKVEETSAESEVIKYNEIRNVCREFVEIATQDAMVIINEHHQPKYRKSIPVCAQHVVDGRGKESGRGFDGGYYYTYELHNISYIVCEDYNGVFNGNDENASKAGGKERIGSLEYFKAHVSQLHIPLIVTVDYCGYRVIAVSKLPTEKIMFNDEGEVRKISEDFVHGVQTNGEVFVNKNKILNSLFRGVASKLNLAEHACKGLKDITVSTTFASSEIKAYKGSGDEFFLKDFWRSFPPELPEFTPHLLRAPRDQSVFWRQLRPEFCRVHAQALSPDGASPIARGGNDHAEHYKQLEVAVQHLIGDIVPKFGEDISQRDYIMPLSEGLGLDITKEMHSRGINMRHLGLVRSLLWRKLPGQMSMFFNEQFIRTGRDLREELTYGMKIKINSKEYIIEQQKGRTGVITHRRIPISANYTGDPVNNLEAHVGLVSTVKNADKLRSILLAEMVARTIKNIVRLQMRMYARRTKSTSSQFVSGIITDYFNVVTGANANSNALLQDEVFEGIRERFGNCAIRPSERVNFQLEIAPCIVYIIKRLQAMLGVLLSMSCLGEFHERPIGFVFCPFDFVHVSPVVHHNIPIMALADAMIVTLSAQEAEKDTYIEQVLSDAPCVFLKLSERIGTRTTDNKGTLGNAIGMTGTGASGGVSAGNGFSGYYSSGCELEREGPIKSDPFCRAVMFQPQNKSLIDSKFHPAVVPQHVHDQFSVEVFVNCQGGSEVLRVVLMCGRYSIVASRDNYYCFVFMDSMYDVVVKIVPVQYNVWVHMLCTYDGTTLRCYIDSKLIVSLEMEVPLQSRIAEYDCDMSVKKKEIDDAEAGERALIKAKCQLESDKFFQTKEGISAMKKSSQNIMESQEFQDANHGKNARDEMQSIKEKKLEAIRQAKVQYATDLYIKTVRDVAERFRLMREELADRMAKDKEEGGLRSRKGLRIGSSCSSSGAKEGKNYFYGFISCVAIYSRKSLTADRIQAHYLAAAYDKTREAQRLHAVASSKYAEAMIFAADDVMVLRGFAKSLCGYLQVEQNSLTQSGVSSGKLKILDAIDEFTARSIPDGIAEIIMNLPRDVQYAEIVCKGFKAIKKMDKDFFVRSQSMTRRDLIHLPRLFDLENPGNIKEYVDTAAAMFKEVTRDVNLRFVYGEIELGWLGQLGCSELVVALVKHASEDKHLRMVKVGELFRSAGKHEINVSDEDVLILCANLLLATGFDLSGCNLLTNSSLGSLSSMKGLRIINLDGCEMMTDLGLRKLVVLCEQLEVLSLARLPLISDDGLLPIVTTCHSLVIFNVNNSPKISHELLFELCKNNRRLSTLHAAATHTSDKGLCLIASVLSKKNMTSLDVSFCRDVTDYAIVSISENCPNLKFLNICGLSRVSDTGIRNICSNCWYLEILNCEDIFLLDDEAFWFNQTFDGRPAANENMLKSLVTLNLRDCVNITDHGIQGLSERCRKIEKLTLRGCDKLTDRAVQCLGDVFLERVPLADSLLMLDLSFCGSVTATGVLKLLPVCGILEDLRLSGMATVNDNFILQMCKTCSTIQKITMQKCVFVTDVSLCSLADFLWIEYLDISGCTRVTDEGIEILTMSCNGINELHLRRVHRISDHGLNALARNCRGLRVLDVTDCPAVTAVGIEDLKHHQHLVAITCDQAKLL